MRLNRVIPWVFGLMVLFVAAMPVLAQDPEFEDFSPGLLPFALAACVFMAIVFAIWVAAMAVFFVILAAACLAGILMLMLGIVSSSVLIGFLNRRVGSGFKAFAFQFGGVIGTLVGAILFFFFNEFLTLGFPSNFALILGALGGLIVGLVSATAFNMAWTKTAQFLLLKLKARQQRSEGNAAKAT